MNQRRVTACGFVVLAAVAGASTSATASAPSAGADAWHARVTALFLYGSADGYAQVPTGGDPGTTSRNRPGFDEVGIDHVTTGDFQSDVGRGPQNVFFGAQPVRLCGSGVLDRALVSQGHPFPAGTDVDAHLNLDWYRAGYRYDFHLPGSNGDGVPVVTLAPYAAADILDAEYQLAGRGARARRTFLKPGVQLGLQGEWWPGGPVGFGGELAGFPQVGSLPTVLVGQLDVRYRFWQSGPFAATAIVGARYEQIDFRDHQDVPNEIHARLGSTFVAGLELRF